MVFVSSMIIAILKLMLLHRYDSVKIIDVICFLWTTFIANFGGKPISTKIEPKKSYKAIIFVSLLSGTVIWIFYRGYLTAELAFGNDVYHFVDMESFSKTNWR